jgi:hypothetical protein
LVEQHWMDIDFKRMVLGLLLALVGIMLVLGQLGILPPVRPWGYFGPALLIGLGLSRLLQSRPDGRSGRGTWLVVIGVWLLLSNLHVWRARETWPLLLVALGLGMVWRAMHRDQSTEGAGR